MEVNLNQLNGIIPLVRGNLGKLQRRTLAALTTIDVPSPIRLV